MIGFAMQIKELINIYKLLATLVNEYWILIAYQQQLCNMAIRNE
jgi:hypothetical protein